MKLNALTQSGGQKTLTQANLLMAKGLWLIKAIVRARASGFVRLVVRASGVRMGLGSWPDVSIRRSRVRGLLKPEKRFGDGS